VEVAVCAAVRFVAREQVNGVLSGGVRCKFRSEVFNCWNRAGGKFALSVALTDDDFGADVAFGVEDIAFVEGDGFRNPTVSLYP
jgi:hypothetical protein